MKGGREQDQETAERLRRENLERVDAGGCAPPVYATNPESAAVEAVARYELVMRSGCISIELKQDGQWVDYEDHQSALDALRGEVVSTNARCIELGERIARLADLRANDAKYIKKLDGIIEETGVRPVSCINPYEDLKAVVLWQKKRIEDLEAAPDGSWLWGRLMDWCRAQGVSPATQDSLFAIATEAHKRATLTKESP